MIAPANQIFTLAQITKSVKELLETAFASIAVRGELKEAKVGGSGGHVYGKLTDGTNNISLVIWRSTLLKMRVRPEEYIKQEVVVRGRLSSFPGRSDIQLQVSAIEPLGLGTKLLELEYLRQKLAAEGLFAQERKRDLPPFPKNIAVITSETGAAVHDIIGVWQKRYPLVTLCLFPAQVQGTQAPESLLRALALVKENVPKLELDLLIIGRGGGASEDLSAFNDERVVRAAAAMPIPFISAVGHQVNSTLLDYVADLMATTPTDAAVKAVPDLAELDRFLQISEHRLRAAAELSLGRVREKYNYFQGMLKESVRSQLYTKGQSLDSLADKLAARNPLTNLWAKRALFAEYHVHLNQDIENYVARQKEALKSLKMALNANLIDLLAERQNAVNSYELRLKDLAPQRVLERGYAIVLDEKGHQLNLAEAKVGASLELLLKGGHIAATIDKVDYSD